MSKSEFMSLVRLDRNDFTEREWVALAYAREWTFMTGKEPAPEFTARFERMYSPAERARIRKMLRMMLFANYCGNAVFKRPWRKDAQACELPSLDSRN